MAELDMVWAILSTVLTAVVYGLLGYGKAAAGKKESFKLKKLLRTAVIGVFVGLFLWWQGLSVTAETYAQGEAWLSSGFLVVLVDYIVVAIWKRVSPSQGR